MQVLPSAAFHKGTASRMLETCNYHFDWLIIIALDATPVSKSITASAQIAYLSRGDQHSPLLQPCSLHSNASVCANEITRLISQSCIPVSTTSDTHHFRNTLLIPRDIDTSSIKHRALAKNCTLNLSSHHAVQHPTKIPLTSLFRDPVAARFASSPPFSFQTLHPGGRTITTHEKGEKVAFFELDISHLISAPSTI